MNCNSERRVWFVTETIRVCSSLILTGWQRSQSLGPKIFSQFSTKLRSGLGFSNLYCSWSTTSTLSRSAGSRREDALTVCGRPRKSAMTSSMFLENFTSGLKKKRKLGDFEIIGTIVVITYTVLSNIFHFLSCMGVGVKNTKHKQCGAGVRGILRVTLLLIQLISNFNTNYKQN